MAFRSIILVVLLTIYRSTSWQIPQIPSGHRAQYLVLHGDGGYKYGYDTVDAFAKQSGDSSNQVEGHYFYKNDKGQNVDLKYTAGVQGFVPEGYEKVLAKSNNQASEDFVDDQANTGDASYAFNIDTDTYKRQETSDARGNIQGRYSYSNEAGVHDLTYIAGENTGFVATSGTLSRANGLQVQGYPVIPSSSQQRSSFENQINNGGVYGAVSNSENVAKTAVLPSENDASYSFGFSTDSQSRQETADSSGTVRGSYSFRNSEGNHDLSYVAGADTGFLPTGGSLAVPNGLVPSSNPSQHSKTANGDSLHNFVTKTAAAPSGNDASYSFGFSTDSQSRQETADSSGTVRGSYSFRNSEGNHDLSYVAGADTGFLPTGGSLAVPNGLVPSSNPSQHSKTANGDSSLNFVTKTAVVPSGNDASYSFGFSTDSQSRQETADSSGTVRGSYSFRNSEGNHDLSYVAGADTGFLPTGGSLAVPNGLVPSSNPSQHSKTANGDSSLNFVTKTAAVPSGNDASYSFGFSTDSQSRQETADSSGTVRGSYSFRNSEGNHDLSYVAGADTGFLPTGGSLAVPNGLVPSSNPSQHSKTANGDSLHNFVTKTAAAPSGNDASYSFGFSTDSQSRQETADSSGTVRGSYSFRNSEGNHDLSYVAGADTGFLPTGGSLAVPNGLVPSSNPSQHSKTANGDSSLNFVTKTAVVPSGNDASYSFGFSTDSQSRQETADSSGTVRGSYSFRNSEGNHDLSYVAGADTGFLPTGGSLAVPNGLVPSSNPSQHSKTANGDSSLNFVTKTAAVPSGNDASYSFGFSTDSQSRQETADSSGTVRGSYSFRNSEGNHDLSYVAGADTGFLPTGGSLAVPNGLEPSQYSNTANGAAAGVHVAGADTGFVPTGGTPSSTHGASPIITKQSSSNPDDASYSFSIDTDEYKRHETSDANGNIQGSYSYKNSVGNHDLTFVAGAATGFLPTGGSLRVAPGVTEAQLRQGQTLMRNSPAIQDYSSIRGSGVIAKSAVLTPSNFVVRTYLPPGNGENKYGYIYQTV